MEIKLSKRLAAIAALVPPGMVVADIGTDHAHLPIWLVQQGLIPRAIAMDVARGPLSRAQEAIREARLTHKIETRLSDGFAALRPEEADCAVLAGMGGDLMIRILKDGAQVAASLKTLVLSPQSEIARVRAFLREEGYLIRAEDMVLEDGKYYQMMRAERAARQNKNKDEARIGIESACRQLPQALADQYGELLLRERHPVLQSYLRWERRIREDILLKLESGEGEKTKARREEVQEQLARNRAAWELIGLE